MTILLKKLKKARGFTLVELMIVVVIIGILASLAIYGVNKYIASSKSAEARLGVGAISKGAVAAYEGETMAGALLSVGGSVGSSRGLCAGTTSDASTPATVTNIAGKKYQSGASEWNTGSATSGWTCLKFSMTGPQYYQYNYISPGGSAANTTYSAFAVGDLDGDAVYATFALQGQLIDSGGSKGITLTVSPAPIETNPSE